MKKHILYTTLIAHFFIPLQCINAMTDVIPQLASPTLSAVGRLLCVNKKFYYSYQGLPAHMYKNARQLTKTDFDSIQWGVDRFLLHNPDFCKKLKPHDYTNALVRYAQNKNVIMFTHMIDNESEKNKKIRLKILQQLKCDASSIIDNMKVYSVSNDLKKTTTHEHLQNAPITLFRILLLNNVFQTNNEGLTDLHYVSLYDHATLIPLALSKTKDINSPCGVNAKTALFLATERNRPKMCRQLLNAGADIDKGSITNDTPLTRAVRDHNIPLIKLFIKHHADINKVNNKTERNTPLHIAIEKRHYDVASLLLDNGADIHAQNSDNQCPLHIASITMQLGIGMPRDLLLCLIDRKTLETQDNCGETPLLKASRRSIFLTHFLLRTGANVQSTNYLGNTALHNAAQTGKVSILKELVKHVQLHSPHSYLSYLNAKNNNGKTALDLGFNHPGVYDYLQSLSAETQYNTCIIS